MSVSKFTIVHNPMGADDESDEVSLELPPLNITNVSVISLILEELNTPNSLPIGQIINDMLFDGMVAHRERIKARYERLCEGNTSGS